jgi:hypothetical protein
MIFAGHLEVVKEWAACHRSEETEYVGALLKRLQGGSCEEGIDCVPSACGSRIERLHLHGRGRQARAPPLRGLRPRLRARRVALEVPRVLWTPCKPLSFPSREPGGAGGFIPLPFLQPAAGEFLIETARGLAMIALPAVRESGVVQWLERFWNWCAGLLRSQTVRSVRGGTAYRL